MKPTSDNMSTAAAIKLAPDPKERSEFGFRALRKVKVDGGGGGHDDDVARKVPLQVTTLRWATAF